MKGKKEMKTHSGECLLQMDAWFKEISKALILTTDAEVKLIESILMSVMWSILYLNTEMKVCNPCHSKDSTKESLSKNVTLKLSKTILSSLWSFFHKLSS